MRPNVKKDERSLALSGRGAPGVVSDLPKLIQQRADGSAQARQRCPGDAPDAIMFDCGVAMCQDISKSNDFAKIWDASRDARVLLGDLPQGFADDLEFALDRGMHNV